VNFSSPRPALQIHGQIALRLSPEAGIDNRRKPALSDAIVLEPPMGYRQMIAIINIVQDDAFAGILRHGKADGVSAAIRRQARTTVGVAQIAEIAQSVIVGGDLSVLTAGAGAPRLGRLCPGWGGGAAGPAETRAQRQAGGKGPGHGETFLFRQKVRARHAVSS